MGNWSDIAARANDAVYRTFGIPVVYYAPGAPTGMALTAVRLRRSPEESAAAGAVEGIELRETDFAALGNPLPMPGGVVTMAGTDYVISEPPRNPDPDSGTIVLVLTRRFRSPANA